ncbi:MAG: DUF3048 domain-containing protein [Oscillospiraceae bacterium]|jgi:hypothetical protein|nr:DUF3048 domain-containing protein [Oscillospiraceae bacterium]
MRMKKRRRVILASALTLAAIVAVVLVRAGAPSSPPPAASPPVSPTATPTPLPTPSYTPTPTPTAAPESPPYDGPRNPLTGMPSDGEISSRRPMAVILNNRAIAQPQHGISEADIIYEAPVEGGITRMLAVYQDTSAVGVLGSVRSARNCFVDLAQGHDAVLIHAGGSPQAYAAIMNRGVTNIDGVNGGRQHIFYRDQARLKKMGYEHSLMTSGELIAEYLPTYKLRLDHGDGYEYGATFADDGTPADGVSAAELTVSFSGLKTTSFSLDPPSGQYLVSQYKKPYADGNGGARVSVTNVLVLVTSASLIPGDSEGRLDIRLTGGGAGYFACGGKLVEINWQKTDATAQFVLTRKDGTPLTLGRGRSYFCITPEGANTASSLIN